jgi:hypothetical protein
VEFFSDWQRKENHQEEQKVELALKVVSNAQGVEDLSQQTR